MPTNDITPADLARFIYPVPVGATIPAGTAWVNRETPATFTGPHLSGNDFQPDANTPRWTAEPIEPPMPPLPTEGFIEAWGKPLFRTDRVHLVVATLNVYGNWSGLTEDGSIDYLTPDQIARWRALTVAPVNPTAP